MHNLYRLRRWIALALCPELSLLQAELDRIAAERIIDGRTFAASNVRLRELMAQQKEVHAANQKLYADNVRLSALLAEKT